MTQDTLFEDVPSYDPLPETGSVEGFGLSEENLPTVKAADLVDMDIAVVGFIVADNQFKESDSDPDKVVAYEFMDSTGANALFWHTSPVLKRQVEFRHENGQIPFRTKLVLKEPKKATGRQYYSFV
jgi:hypothetical protein